MVYPFEHPKHSSKMLIILMYIGSKTETCPVFLPAIIIFNTTSPILPGHQHQHGCIIYIPTHTHNQHTLTRAQTHNQQ